MLTQTIRAESLTVFIQHIKNKVCKKCSCQLQQETDLNLKSNLIYKNITKIFNFT